MTKFTEEVLEIVKMIPNGKVMTYGQIAAYAGNPRGARQVSRILHSMSAAYHLPWHRVINSKGTISLTGEEGYLQGSMLSNEGIDVLNEEIDLHKYLFKM